jgi:hypothetical protein
MFIEGNTSLRASMSPLFQKFGIKDEFNVLSTNLACEA